MYLPTFWSLTMNAYAYKLKHMSGWGVPALCFLLWIGKDSIYNWTFSCIIPPPRGVPKRNM